MKIKKRNKNYNKKKQVELLGLNVITDVKILLCIH